MRPTEWRGAGFSFAGALLAVGIVARPAPTLAQTINIYFPPGTYGYDQQLGVTVLTRERHLYDPLGIKAGGFTIHPSADAGLFYNSNVTGTAGSGSWGSRTSASVSAASDWSRNSLNASVGVDRFQFFDLPTENYTNFNVGLSAGYSIGDSQLLGAYTHQTYNQIGSTIGAVRSVVPVQNETDTARVEYTFNLGRVSITPDLSASAYRFGSATVQGVTFNQNYLNRNVLAAGATTRYALNEQGGLLFVVRALDNVFTQGQPGQPTNDSRAVLVLGGLDYQAVGVWRYRLLAGVQVRSFAARQYGTRTAPDVEGSVIWSPTGLTTVTATLSNAIESPETAGTSGFMLTQGRVVVDHELRRNVLLQGRTGVQYAQYLQSQVTQSNLTGGAGVTWLVARGVRLSLDYDYTDQSVSHITTGPRQPQSLPSGAYRQSLVALTVHLAL